MRKIQSDGTLITLAGDGTRYGSINDHAIATATGLYYPTSIIFGPDGLLYISDTYVVRRLGVDGYLSSVVGTGDSNAPAYQDGGIANAQQFLSYGVSHELNVAFDSQARLHVVNGSRVYRVESDNTINTIGGGGSQSAMDEPHIADANFPAIRGFVMDSQDNMYISAFDSCCNGAYAGIFKVDTGGYIHLLAGGGQNESPQGFATDIRVPEPNKMALGHNGDIYFTTGSNTTQYPGLKVLTTDQEAPQIGYWLDPSPNQHGWTNGDTTVNFYCYDELSGIESCTAPITLTGEGMGLTATGVATDKSGNTGSITVSDINIDRTNPTITYSVSPAPNPKGWNNTDIIVTFDCSDALSGIDTCTDQITVSTDGANQSVIGTATDLAGNSISITAEGINIDRTAPMVTNVQISPGVVLLNGNFTITANVADALSGVEYVEYYIDTDPGQGSATQMTFNGSQASASSSASSLSNGQHTVYVRARDNAGNWSTVESNTFVRVGLF